MPLIGPGADGALRRTARAHPLGLFWLLACGLSWAWWVPMAVAGASPAHGVGWPTHLPGLLGPAVAAFMVAALAEGRVGVAALAGRLVRWRAPGPAWAVVVVTVALIPVVAGVLAASGRPLPPLEHYALYNGIGSVGLLGVVVVALMVDGIGEETGWRGFAADRLLRSHGVTRTAVVVAAMWAVWHLPLFWVLPSLRDLGPAGVVGWSAGLLAGSVVLTALYRSAAASVLVVAAWHTAFNLGSATEGTTGLPAAVLSMLVMVAALAVVLVDRGARRRPRDTRPETPAALTGGAR